MYIELILAGLLVFSNSFWAYVCHRLVNKLMSRSFYEYKDATLQAEKLKVESKKKDVDFHESEFEDFGAMQEIMPMG